MYIDLEEKINKLLKSKNFQNKTTEEKKQEVLKYVEGNIEEIAKTNEIKLSDELSIVGKLYDISRKIEAHTWFEKIIFTSLLKSMSVIESHEIMLNKTTDRSVRMSPVYVYNEDEKLIRIDAYEEMNYFILATSLLYFFDKRFMMKPEVKKLLKK